MLTPKFLTKFTAIVGTFAFLFLTVGCSAPNPGASGTVRADSPSAVPVTCKLPSPHGSVSDVTVDQCKSLLKTVGCETPGSVVGDTMKCSTTAPAAAQAPALEGVSDLNRSARPVPPVSVTCKLPSPHGSVSGVSEGQCKSLLKIAGCATPGAVVGDTMKCSTTNKPK